MSSVLKIEIKESADTLKKLMYQQEVGKPKDRIQVLYWLKAGYCSSIKALSSRTGYGQDTISRWLSRYRKGGLEAVLSMRKY